MKPLYDIASYILENEDIITTMKLQKLTYYCQALSLAKNNVPLFNQDFRVWSNGPVCKELFNLHRGKFLIKKRYTTS